MKLRRYTYSEIIYKTKVHLLHYIYKPLSSFIRYEDYAKQFPCYRYALKHGDEHGKNVNYLTAVPNPGAGIGHQMANWMAGYHYAKVFNLQFAHIPFSGQHHPLKANQWDYFLGFGGNEVLASDLFSKGYKKVVLPIFKNDITDQVEIIRNIIAAYSNQNVVFVCSQDEFYRDLQTLIPNLQQKFFSAPSRKKDQLSYSKENFNIAIHIRRGDIMDNPSNPNLTMRILGNNYFSHVLKQAYGVLSSVEVKPIHIYFFTQGRPEDFPEFKDYPNVHWCNDMGAVPSFLHMVYADLLITSKSSFSYKPALLNKGIKLCPKNFWHGYPNAPQWILCDDEGNFDTNQLKKLLQINIV